MLAMAMDFISLPVLLAVAIWLRYEGLNAELLRHYFWLLIAAPLISIPCLHASACTGLSSALSIRKSLGSSFWVPPLAC
jgi:hypothetical protein